jgi:general stress protein YciG
MNNVLTISEFARLGGKARAAKLTKEQLSAIGKKGGRPRNKLDKAQKTTPNT